eukprot:TRINITY_DN12227_c0_g1_i2.p1 TRINITY_DN12227_c0_g1~~TRINITY_DN12227_c0_g1_i2.p1  ORF type:complete len:192 (+),score=45.49 TRINITY_DN12227_c0_g1_i2:58-576(+)
MAAPRRRRVSFESGGETAGASSVLVSSDPRDLDFGAGKAPPVVAPSAGGSVHLSFGFLKQHTVYSGSFYLDVGAVDVVIGDSVDWLTVEECKPMQRAGGGVVTRCVVKLTPTADGEQRCTASLEAAGQPARTVLFRVNVLGRKGTPALGAGIRRLSRPSLCESDAETDWRAE